MSDESVREALRSKAQLVVIEAPAGCGKTYQGADYAREIATALDAGRLLILTHTHAACSVFAERTKGHERQIEIRTLDSLISNVASAYQVGLGLPQDIHGWVRQQKDGYRELAAQVADLLTRHPMIAGSLSHRYPIIICDEHQDSSPDQHAVVTALFAQGAGVRVFADPMQKIFSEKFVADSTRIYDWSDLTKKAHAFEQLDVPHRWASGCHELGKWVLYARELLKAGQSIDLRRRLPTSVTVVFAENQAQRTLDYNVSRESRNPIDKLAEQQSSLLVLTRYSNTAKFLRAFFNRRIPLWEGHTRPALEKLVDSVSNANANRAILAEAIVAFMAGVGKGFSPSAFGNKFKEEVNQGCLVNRRGKSAKIQDLARLLVAEADHRGVAKVLRQLSELKDADAIFSDVEIDCNTEFRDAIRLGEFETAIEGLAQITHRRSYSRPRPPSKAISTIHKAKGLECESVIILPCDAQTFPDTPDARCLLYVAISRAKKQLMLVISRSNPSPLFRI